eukprot:6719149-Prymnesium_polylepis.1
MCIRDRHVVVSSSSWHSVPKSTRCLSVDIRKIVRRELNGGDHVGVSVAAPPQAMRHASCEADALLGEHPRQSGLPPSAAPTSSTMAAEAQDAEDQQYGITTYAAPADEMPPL